MNTTYSARKGLTLVELMIACSVMVVLVTLAAVAMNSFMRVLGEQTAITAVDNQGLKMMDDLSKMMETAIFPAKVYRQAVDEFKDVDSALYGFGGLDGSANPTGSLWRERMNAGMDNVAFAMPLVIENVDSKKMLIGQLRGDAAFLGAATTVTDRKSDSIEVTMRDDAGTELVNILADLDVSKFDNLNFEKVEIPTSLDWRNLRLNGSGWPARTAFVAVRFIPLLDSSNNPVVISESNAFRGTPMDLDGDLEFDQEFQIGKIQLLYSGGTLPMIAPTPDGHGGSQLDVVDESVPQLCVAMTRNTVLRYNNPTDRIPMFQLIDTYPYNPSGSGRTRPAGSDNYTSLLRMRFLMVDNIGLDDNVLLGGGFEAELTSRWYETTVSLKNMR